MTYNNIIHLFVVNYYAVSYAILFAGTLAKDYKTRIWANIL